MHAVIFALNVKHAGLQIAWFLKVARPFVVKVCKEKQATDGYFQVVGKAKNACL